MRRAIFPRLLFASLCLSSGAFALESDDPAARAGAEETMKIFSIKGNFKSLFVGMRTDDYSGRGPEKDMMANLNRLRLSPELALGDHLILHADMDNELIASNFMGGSEYDALFHPPDYDDFMKPEWEPWRNRRLEYRDRVHRAFAKLRAGDFTVTAGRQLVRFGSGRLWNPLDIMSPVPPTSIEGPEEARGIDALRVEYFPGEAAVISVVANPMRIDDRDPRDHYAAGSTNLLGRAKIALGNTDIAAIGGRVSYRDVGGIDLATTLVGGTARGALLYSSPEVGRDFVCAGAGYEYTFGFGATLLVEYFYNQYGLNNDIGLRTLYMQDQYPGPDETSTRALSYRFITFNRHYAAAALGYDITPLLRADFFTIADVEGRGLFFNPALKYNALENIDISVAVMTAHVFRGAGVSSDFDPYTENGIVIASLTWYF
jgi:hypothetical protein